MWLSGEKHTQGHLVSINIPAMFPLDWKGCSCHNKDKYWSPHGNFLSAEIQWFVQGHFTVAGCLPELQALIWRIVRDLISQHPHPVPSHFTRVTPLLPLAMTAAHVLQTALSWWEYCIQALQCCCSAAATDIAALVIWWIGLKSRSKYGRALLILHNSEIIIRGY